MKELIELADDLTCHLLLVTNESGKLYIPNIDGKLNSLKNEITWFRDTIGKVTLDPTCKDLIIKNYQKDSGLIKVRLDNILVEILNTQISNEQQVYEISQEEWNIIEWEMHHTTSGCMTGRDYTVNANFAFYKITGTSIFKVFHFISDGILITVGYCIDSNLYNGNGWPNQILQLNMDGFWDNVSRKIITSIPT